MPPKRASRARANKNTDNADVVVEGAVPEVAVATASEDPIPSHSDPASELKAILQRSVKRTRDLFAEDQDDMYTGLSEEQAR